VTVIFDLFAKKMQESDFTGESFNAESYLNQLLAGTYDLSTLEKSEKVFQDLIDRLEEMHTSLDVRKIKVVPSLQLPGSERS
jgi:hypothetical protein